MSKARPSAGSSSSSKPQTSVSSSPDSNLAAGPTSIPGFPRPPVQMSPVMESSPYSDSEQSTDTVRRVTDRDIVPGSVESFNTARESSHPDHEPIPPTLSRHSSQASLQERPLLDKRQRRKSISRKGSMAPQPLRVQGFSAEDDASEVEEDQKQAVIGSGFSPIRRPSQRVLRRRTSQHPGRGEVQEIEATDERVTLEPEAPNDSGGTDMAGSDEISDAGSAESFTLKDRQEAINVTHPFGIRIWKPALYKKNRSVQRTAEGDIHSAPGGRIGPALFSVNVLWVFMFGWWMATITAIAGIGLSLFAFTASSREYSWVIFGLARYLLYPFGRFVQLEQQEEYLEEDEGEGRSISEYEQWQAGDIESGRTFFGPHRSRHIVGHRRDSLDTISENESLLGSSERTGLTSGIAAERRKRRLFGRGQWTLGRVMFYLWFYLVIAPALLIVSGICWFLVFWIPMGKVTYLLFDHLRRHPLALSFHSDSWMRRPGTPHSSILVCTYRAAGWKYYKYTVDGTNIYFINLMTVVVFVVFDYFFLHGLWNIPGLVTSPATMFTLALVSIIPLAYFIGQAVASISAQSSMGVGAAINAFFSTVVEVYLYCIALTEGKGRLVEGSIVGSIFAGVVLMPGMSMCSGGFKRKTQRFNAQSAGVTSTMLLYAVIAVFAPTLFSQIYGTYELSCHSCSPSQGVVDGECRKCMFTPTPMNPSNKLFREAVQPFVYLCAILLFISYAIGLWFTLKTHAAMIWSTPVPKPAPPPSLPSGHLRESRLQESILERTTDQLGLHGSSTHSQSDNVTPHMVPPKSSGHDLVSQSDVMKTSPVRERIARLTTQENVLVRDVAQVAAAAATAALRDEHERAIRRRQQARSAPGVVPVGEEEIPFGVDAATVHGGHDAPNWGRTKSSVILLGATVLYAIIAEILVNTVDVVLENVDVDEKFLGMTLFALVPNTTEFLNAISFAMNGNIALSMEIGSAYALQVCLLQIPALVVFSAWYGSSLLPEQWDSHTFSLIFPQWDLITVILCVFILSYMYGEGKSNYFKGSILILSYVTVMTGFHLASYAQDATLGIQAVILGAGSKAHGGSQYYLAGN